MMEEMKKKLVMKDEDCENLKGEIVSLKKEIELLNKNLKIYQTLDDILSHQISPLDKLGLGYAGETSNKTDANPNASNNKDVEKLGRNIDVPSSSKSMSQDDIGRNPTSRRYEYSAKNASGNKFDSKIPKKNDFRSIAWKSSSSKYKIIFFGYFYS